MNVISPEITARPRRKVRAEIGRASVYFAKRQRMWIGAEYGLEM